jgi:NTE family protein
MKTALVLSAGGMFGAYQAGIWKILSTVFQPDLVVGASIGAVNGWAIAGGCPPDQLIESWLGLKDLGAFRWRLPTRPWHGFIDSSPVERLVEQTYHDFVPQLEYGVVATDTLRLRPVLFCEPGLTWQHLAASTAMLGFFSQHRIGGRIYSDGGLLSALPVWAAVEMGATRIVAINVLPDLPSFVVKNVVGIIRAAARYTPPALPASVEVIRITAPLGLGTAKDALYWKRENVRRWIEQGQQDAQAALAAGRIPFEVNR